MTGLVWRARIFLTRFLREMQNGADFVVNLAAGLDAQPYRIKLPTTLQWLEVDLPDIVYYEEDVLENEKPRCRLERIPLDLSDAGAPLTPRGGEQPGDEDRRPDRRSTS